MKRVCKSVKCYSCKEETDDCRFPCGCALCAGCLKGLPCGAEALSSHAMIRHLLCCECGVLDMFGLTSLCHCHGYLSLDPFDGCELSEHASKALSTLEAIVMSIQYSLGGSDLGAMTDIYRSFLSELAEGMIYKDLVPKVLDLLDGLKFDRCGSCATWFCFVGGCGDRSAYSACHKCRTSLVSWDDGKVLHCANPFCRRLLLRERGVDPQCNVTGCACCFDDDDSQDEMEMMVHELDRATCARCGGLCGNEGSFFPLTSLDNWKHHFFQVAAGVTLPVKYLFDEDGLFQDWVLEKKASLYPRLTHEAEGHVNFPGYCGCAELQSYLFRKVESFGSFHEARDHLKGELDHPSGLVAHGASLSQSPTDVTVYQKMEDVMMGPPLVVSCAMAELALIINDASEIVKKQNNMESSLGRFPAMSERVTQLCGILESNGWSDMCYSFFQQWEQNVVIPLSKIFMDRVNQTMMMSINECLPAVKLVDVSEVPKSIARSFMYEWIMRRSGVITDGEIWKRAEILGALVRLTARGHCPDAPHLTETILDLNPDYRRLIVRESLGRFDSTTSHLTDMLTNDAKAQIYMHHTMWSGAPDDLKAHVGRGHGANAFVLLKLDSCLREGGESWCEMRKVLALAFPRHFVTPNVTISPDIEWRPLAVMLELMVEMRHKRMDSAEDVDRGLRVMEMLHAMGVPIEFSGLAARAYVRLEIAKMRFMKNE